MLKLHDTSVIFKTLVRNDYVTDFIINTDEKFFLVEIELAALNAIHSEMVGYLNIGTGSSFMSNWLFTNKIFIFYETVKIFFRQQAT